MSEAFAECLNVWSAMQGDPAMLDAISFGDLEKLISGMETLFEQDDVKAAFPLSLARRLYSLDRLNFAEQIETVREVFSLQPIRAFLNKEAGID